MNNKLNIKYLIIFILSIHSLESFGQIIDDEQASSKIKWRQIETKNFIVLFPQTFENTAIKFAKELPSLRIRSSKDLLRPPHKTTLILQGNHVNQNGYVQLAPRKSELYPVPSSTADNQEWLSNLALHELRHVAQFDKLTGNIRKPFFEQLALALYALNLPAWYFEGDAVQVETIYSNGGRGRLPSWEMPIRANILSGRNYNFNKYVHGSFKDNVPSHYNIGFLMSTYMTNHFGLDSHEKIMEEMRKKLLRPFNFQRSVKHVSGLKPNQLFKETIQELHQKWEKETPDYSGDNDIKTNKSPYPSDYLFPQELTANNWVALKTSPQRVNEITIIDSLGNEKGLVKTGLQITPYFQLRGKEIVWDELRKDARFGKQTYNVINLYNVETKHSKTLTKNSRYYSPALHPLQDEILVVEVNLAGNSSMLTLDAKTGNVLDSIAIPKGIHVQQPKYNATGDKVVAIAVGKEGTNLIEFDLPQKTNHLLLTWGHQQLDRPSYYQEDILFKAHFDGIDNIYKLDREGRTTKVTNARFGAFNAYATTDGSILYNDYRYNGYKPAKQTLSEQLDTAQRPRTLYILPTLQQASLPIVLEDQDSSFSISDYNPTKHAVNFHSLSISGSNFESFGNYIPGIFWLSNDVLNTTQIKLGYEYDPDISKSIYSAEVSYRRFFPTFTLRYANRGAVGNAVSSADPKKIIMYDYRDHLASFEMSLPFSIYRRNIVYSYGLNFGTSYTKRYDMSVSLKNFNETIAFPLNYQVYLNRNSMRSKMDLAPRWGQNFSVTYRHLPFESGVSGQILSVRTNFYLPGITQNHSLQLRLAAQKSDGRYEGVYDIPMVSGWGHFQSPIVKNTVMANYRLPLFYPDWSIGSLAFIKRFQGLIFADFQNVHDTAEPKSFGIGISTDFKVFKYISPDINVAAKFAYINDHTTDQRIIPSFGLSYSY